jgi:glutathione S-transferase-like protein
MKLYVCYGTWKPSPLPGGHPCGVAYDALKDAGYNPEVARAYGSALLPGIFNRTPGRREVKELTDNYWVPVLVTDAGEVIQGSQEIVEWAKAHPSPAVDVNASVT